MLKSQKLLQPLLRDDIRASVERFSNLPHNLREAYDLSSSPIDIVLGTDVESMLFQNGKLISKGIENKSGRPLGYHPRALDFIERCRDELADLFFQPFDTYDPIYFDQKRIEANLLPSDPVGICDIYHEYNERSCEIANDMGLDFAIGPGHWHVSLWQDGKNILARDSDYSNFGHYAGIGITVLQEHLPAFFVRPRIANSFNDFGRGSIVREINCARHYMFSENSVRIRHHHDFKTIENRLADGSPEQSVALTLKGILLGLEHEAEDPHCSQSIVTDVLGQGPLGVVFKKAHWKSSDVKVVHAKWRGGFKMMLDITKQSPLLPELFDKEVSGLLMLEAVERCRQYLEWPVAKQQKNIVSRMRLKRYLNDLHTQYSSEQEKAPLLEAGL